MKYIPISFEWRWWRRFNLEFGTNYHKPYRIKRRFDSLYCKKLFKKKVRFNVRFGTPRKYKAFDKMRFGSVLRLKNKFHFTRVIS